MSLLTLIATLAVAASPANGTEVLRAFHATVPLSDLQASLVRSNIGGPSFSLATVRSGHRIALHASPGGPVVRKVGHRTGFGSKRVFWIERVRGSWLGAPVPELPDGQLGWIRDDPLALEFSHTRYWISANVSRRRVELHYGNRVLEAFPVTVGSPSAPTPPGNYAVTDGLVGRGLGPWYGCCLLALSGHQSKLPAGWIGGDRIAIHGTPGSVGGAESHGCLRASNMDMVSLFARVPLGTPVFIRA